MTPAAFSLLLLAEPCVLGLRVIWLRCLHPQMLGALAVLSRGVAARCWQAQWAAEGQLDGGNFLEEKQ